MRRAQDTADRPARGTQTHARCDAGVRAPSFRPGKPSALRLGLTATPQVIELRMHKGWLQGGGWRRLDRVELGAGVGQQLR